MEERAHTKKRSAAPRGVQAPHQDPVGPAFAETTAMAVLGIARRRSDHHSQSQRMAGRSAPSSLIPPLTSPRDPIFLPDRRSRQSQFQHKIATPPCELDGRIVAKLGGQLPHSLDFDASHLPKAERL